MHPAMRLIARLWIAIGLVMLIATLAACGGGGDDCTEAPDHLRTDRELAQWRQQCEAGADTTHR